MNHQAIIDTLSFTDLTFNFDQSRQFLKEVSYDFPMDQNIVLQGQNGTGKSTILRLLAGLTSPISGSYVINSENASEMSFEEFLPYRLSIGFGFDLGGLLSNRTLEENILLPLVYHNLVSLPEGRMRADYYLKKFDIYQFKDQRPAHVTGRVRKVTTLIRSFVMHPQVLLLDDPTEGLSRVMIQTLLSVLKDLRKRGDMRHLFLTSNYESFVDELECGRIAIVDNKIVDVHPHEPKKVSGL